MVLPELDASNLAAMAFPSPRRPALQPRSVFHESLTPSPAPFSWPPSLPVPQQSQDDGITQVLLSPSPSPSPSVSVRSRSSQGPRPHWDQDSLFILVTAIHHENPFKFKRVKAKAEAWNKVYAEVSSTLRQKRLPHRDLASMKTKCTQLSNTRKAHNQTARGALGVVEHTSDFQRMINNVVQSDLGNMHPRLSAATADAHRSMLATLSCEPHVSAAGRSMQPMSQRRVSSTSESDASETSVILNNAEKDTGVAVEGPQVSCKRGRIALAETLDAMIEADRVHRKGADDMRLETLKIKKAHLDIQKVSLEVQKGMVETGRTFITQMSSDLTTVKNDMESLKTLVQSTMEQQKQAINSLLDMMRGLVSQGSGTSVIPLEAAVPSAPSTTVPSQPMHPITEEPTTPRAQRCVSVESTTNATPTRNSPLSEVSRLRSPESV